MTLSRLVTCSCIFYEEGKEDNYLTLFIYSDIFEKHENLFKLVLPQSTMARSESWYQETEV